MTASQDISQEKYARGRSRFFIFFDILDSKELWMAAIQKKVS